MATEVTFRISSHLKDIIGRDLVTNEFVAVFELVKNAFDAEAKKVKLVFDNDGGELWIVDDGKGMDAEIIQERWLFVAYSAKADGTEDGRIGKDYRDHIRPQGQYAGSKGIGRFSCDTLGKTLTLYTRKADDQSVQKLWVDWGKFEKDSKELFQTVGVTLEAVQEFPENAPIKLPPKSGTVLRIGNLRGLWGSEQILKLRRYLEKLIDPFGSTRNTPVDIRVIDESLSEAELSNLQGPIGNDLRDLLDEKTTRISVVIDDAKISTELVDRGVTIYRIAEDNEFSGLFGSKIECEIFYLNRSAKHTFTSRMGVQPVKFGSVFLFLNGFRIFPIGEETDDTLGLNRRKQQGSARYLGTRDIMGRVDVSAPPRMFREASSRDAGLIEDAHTRDLYEAILRKAIVRLERYVVGVMWPDKADHDREDASALALGPTRGRIAQVIGQMASSKNLQIEYYDPGIIELFDEDERSLENALKSLTAIAERQGDAALLRRIENARARQLELEEAEREAAIAARRAMAEKAIADQRIASLERQATYLASTQDLKVEQMMLLLHQVMIYSGHIGAAVDRALETASGVIEAATDLETEGESEDLLDAAAAIRAQSRSLMNDLEYIHLENDRLTAVARFAANARFDLETDLLDGDVVEFFDEYVNQVRALRDGTAFVTFESNELSQYAHFRPVDLVVVVDNLLDNARKHGARQMTMSARKRKGSQQIEIAVTDDGRGIDEARIDPERIFEKGYTGTVGGTGLGLYHARKVMEDMGGGLTLDPSREPGRAEFVIALPKQKT